jgi:hypothetical protein
VYAVSDLVKWQDDDGDHMGEVMDVAFDGLEAPDVPVYKVKVYEYADGEWVPRRVVVVHAEGMESAYGDYDDEGYEDDDEGHGMKCSCGGSCPMCHGADLMASPMYGKAVVLASARRDAEAKRASLVYRSVVPLFAEDPEPHTAAFRIGRRLSPAELQQRKMAAQKAAEKRKQMRLSNRGMMEERRAELRRAEREMKSKRKLARQSMKQQRKKGGYWKQAGRAAKHALGHEFETAARLFTGKAEVTPFARPRRSSLDSARMARIAALAGRD